MGRKGFTDGYGGGVFVVWSPINVPAIRCRVRQRTNVWRKVTSPARGRSLSQVDRVEVFHLRGTHMPYPDGQPDYVKAAWAEFQKDLDKYIDHYKAFLEEALSKSPKGIDTKEKCLPVPPGAAEDQKES
jgi:hypothetical protein